MVRADFTRKTSVLPRMVQVIVRVASAVADPDIAARVHVRCFGMARHSMLHGSGMASYGTHGRNVATTKLPRRRGMPTFMSPFLSVRHGQEQQHRCENRERFLQDSLQIYGINRFFRRMPARIGSRDCTFLRDRLTSAVHKGAIEFQMIFKKSVVTTLLLSFGMLAAGCAVHEHRVYDPYYSDYHTWGPDEDAYYHQWYTVTYHDRGYRDYKHLNRDEQRNYWNWRHSHQDHDHDNNRH